MRIRTSPPVWYLTTLILHLIVHPALFRIRVKGHRQARGPAVIVGKHSSYWDVPITGIRGWMMYRSIPRFEMGSFVGYALLGKLEWLFRLLGGFPVMRAKDILRLKHITGGSRAEVSEVMKSVNNEAKRMRREVFESEGVFCFFPEGARNKAAVGRMRSRHEIDEAIEFAREHPTFHVQPIICEFGPSPRFRIPFLIRRTVQVVILDPIPLTNTTTQEVLEAVDAGIRANWSACLDGSA